MLFFKDMLINILLSFVRIDVTSELSIQLLNKGEPVQAIGLSKFDILFLSLVRMRITKKQKNLKIYRNNLLSYTISGAEH